MNPTAAGTLTPHAADLHQPRPVAPPPALPVLSAATRAAYAADWALFRTWCAAADRPTLPTDPDTVALFTTENPAAASTTRRRLRAIELEHHRAGLLSPLPHRPAAPRPPAIDPARLAEVLPALPTTGWAAGLFGRRDALLLTLRAHTHLTVQQLTHLRTGHLRVEPATGNGPADLLVDVDGHTNRVAGHDDPRICPACTWYRWRKIRELLIRYPGPRLADALRTANPVTAGSPHRCTRAAAAIADVAVFIPINRWGTVPAAADQTVSTRTVHTLTTAHLTGHAPRHSDPSPPPLELPELPAAPPPPAPDPQAAAALYLAGLAARRLAQQQLARVGAVLDDVDAAATELTHRLADLAAQFGGA